MRSSGYVCDQADVEEFTATASEPEFYKFFLDVFPCLVLAQHPFATYEKGVKAHADALEADCGRMLASEIKISYETPYPEIMIQ